MLVRKLFFLPEEVIMKRMNFLIGMTGISLALGMMVIGCDTGGGGGGGPGTGGGGGSSKEPAREFLSAQVPSPVASPPLLFAFMDPSTGNAVGVYKVGSIANQLIAHDALFYHDGLPGLAITFSLTNTNETAISRTITNSVEASVSAGVTTKVSVGVEAKVLGGKVKGEAEVGASVEAGIKELESYQTTESVKTSRTFSQVYNFDFTERPEGYYIFGAFSFVDYYIAVSVNPSTKTVVKMDGYHGIDSAPVTKLEYSATNPTASGGLAISNNKKLNVNFTADPVKIVEEAAKNPVVTPPVVETPALKTTSSVYVYDGDSIRIDESTGQKHTNNTRQVGLDIDALKKAGYTKISIAMDIQIRAQDTGDGRKIWLDIDNERVWGVDNLNVTNKDWYNVKHNQSVDINAFKTESKFRFGFDTKDYILSNAIWYFNEANVTFTAVK
jgi:hypothetical protein